MTHAEALRSDRQHFPGRGCPGELAETGRYPAAGIGPAGRVDVVVALYRCPECGCALSIEHESGRVRNCYPVPPRQMVRELGDRLDARPHLPRTKG